MVVLVKAWEAHHEKVVIEETDTRKQIEQYLRANTALFDDERLWLLWNHHEPRRKGKGRRHRSTDGESSTRMSTQARSRPQTSRRVTDDYLCCSQETKLMRRRMLETLGSAA
jgi:hypothetical protein